MKFMYIILEGVAVGCGWQTFVAYVNVGCYYVVGVPLGALLGFYFKLGAKVISPISVNVLHNQIVSSSLVIIEKITTLLWCIQGIWSGMLGGTVMQTIILIWITARTDWNKEVKLFNLSSACNHPVRSTQHFFKISFGYKSRGSIGNNLSVFTK